jgi:IclR family pca regulon transcriptional regulator
MDALRQAASMAENGMRANRTTGISMPRDLAKPSGHFSQSLARGLEVIRAFDRDAPMLRIADVAKRTRLDRAAARRFLLTLVELGYVGRSDDLFYLRPRALDIGFSYLASLDLTRVIQPLLGELTDVTHETSSFGILDGGHVRLLARSAKNGMMNVSVPLGVRVPAFGASLGRVLLAALPAERLEAYVASLPATIPLASGTLDRNALRRSIDQARELGWAAVAQDLGRGFCSIAVPVRGRDGRAVAAVNVVEYPPRNATPTMARKYLPLLRDTAKQIEAALHASQHAVVSFAQEPDMPALVG